MSKTATATQLLNLIKEILTQTDRYAVFELLNQYEPQVVADVYKQLQIDFYWTKKDLPTTVAFSQAGIHHNLAAASKATDTAEANALRGAAKQLAYNLASFTWPGWNEPGIHITTADLPVGLEAARLNLRLAQELDRPDKAKANALWMLGAHQLAAADYSSAIDTFLQGKSRAIAAEDLALAEMIEGYVWMARLVAGPQNAEARIKFDGVVCALKERGTEDSLTYAEQMRVALNVFQTILTSSSQ